MKKLIIFLVLSVMLAACGPATKTGVNKVNTSKNFDPATVNRVAIVDFDVNKGIKYSTDVLADKFTAELVGSEIFSLMDRNDIKKVMHEVGFQQKGSLAGILNDATLERLHAMGADSVLTGKLVSFRQVERNGLIVTSEAQLTAKLLKIESGEVIWSAEIHKSSKTKKGRDAESAEVLLSDIIEQMCVPLNTENKFKRIIGKF